MRSKVYTKQQLAFELLRRTGSVAFTQWQGTCTSCQPDKETGKSIQYVQVARNGFREEEVVIGEDK